MSRIALATFLVLMTYEACATAQPHPIRTKACKRMRGSACPQGESARPSTNAASATPLTRAAVSGSIRGRQADTGSPSQCLDLNGAPLAVHSHNGHIYSYVSTMEFESWHDAHLAANNLSCCQAKGRLLVVNDAAESEFIKSFVDPEARAGWIGLVDEANDGVWKGGQATATATAAAAAAASSRRHSPDGNDPENGGDGDIRPADCGSDSTYDDKDYMYGVRCREPALLPIIVEFDCSEAR
jgi:Lectin C-type domain